MASFTEVFGGNVIYPAGQTYLSVTFSTDQTLQWPIEQQVAGDVVSSIMDLDATAAGLNVNLPDATLVSNGIQSVFNNVGANTLTIRDTDGGTIVSLGAGEAWVVYLTDNSTSAGTWRIFQLGASVSVANASALAGAGLKAVSTTLNQTMPPTSTATTPITWTDADRAQLTIWTGGVGILDLPSPATVGSDWFSLVRNGGSGDLTITPPSGSIDDGATLALSPGESAFVVTDGTDFFTVGLGQSSTGVFDFLEINVAGSGDFTLSGVQLNRISYRFTGVLTGDRTIIVPATVQQYWVDNSTTGAFDLDVESSAQVATAPVVIQGARNILYCDGTDVVFAESNTVGFPITVAQGGTGATDAATALANLGGVDDARLINTLALSGMAGGGDLSADRSLSLNSDDLTVETTVDTGVDTLPFYDDSAGAMRKATVDNLLGTSLIVKAANEDRNNTTTLATDADFANIALDASSEYLFEMYLYMDVGTENLKVNFLYTGLLEAGLESWATFFGGGGSPIAITGDLAATVSTVGIGNFSMGGQTGDRELYLVKAYFETDTAGNLNFQWAQNVATAVDTKLRKGSWSTLRKAS